MNKGKSHLASEVKSVIASIARPSGDVFVPLHEPVFQGAELSYVSECIETGWVSSVGAFVDRFEVELAKFCGVERAVATSNGTSALHMCLLLAGVEPNDEVLIPTLTFVATANAVSYLHAVPHFLDSEETSLGLDPDKIAEYLEEIAERREGGTFNRITGRRLGALVPMHAMGHPSQIAKLLELSKHWAIPLVEDAAESLGSYHGQKHTGGFGCVSAMSFNGNKTITTGGGGAILTNDQELANRAKHLTTTAKIPHRWDFVHDEVGYNYRMPNLNAALGVAQLEALPKILAKKRELAEKYQEAFSAVEGLSFLSEPIGCKSNYWLSTLLLDQGCESELEQILELTNDAGLMTRPIWTPMHQLQMYQDCPRMDLSTANSLAQRLLNIPSGSTLPVTS